MESRSSRPAPAMVVVAIVAPPAIWTVHFFVVYLVTEAACRLEVVATKASGWAVVLATVAAAVGFIWSARFGVRLLRAGHHDGESVAGFAGVTGLVLGALSMLATLFVALPAVWIGPC